MRIARKHLGWYTASLAGGAALRREANAAVTQAAQLDAVERFFDLQAALGDRLHYGDDIDETLPPKSQQTTSNANRAREALAA